MSNRSKEEQIYDNLVEIMVETTKPDDEGKAPRLEAATLNAIRQFLKDNNIGADPETHSGLQTLDKQTKAQGRQAPFAERPGEDDT